MKNLNKIVMAVISIVMAILIAVNVYLFTSVKELQDTADVLVSTAEMQVEINDGFLDLFESLL